MDLEGFVDGRALDEANATELPIELDSRRMVDGFEEALVGVLAGEDKTLELAFPESYPEHLAGRPVTFNVRVRRVEEPELPEIDDAFAESFGVVDGGMETLRAEVRANMERELADGMGAVVKQRVMEALLSSNEVELPDSMVRDEVARAMTRRREEMTRSGIDPEQIDLDPAAFEGPVRRRISLDLIVAEIVQQHGVELDHAKVRDRVETIASTYQEPARILEWYYEDRTRLAGIESLVFEDQVVEWVMERAKVTDERTSFDQIMNPVQTAAPTA